MVTLGARALDLGQPVANGRVLGEVAEMAGHRLRKSGERVFLLPHGASKIDNGTIGLELGERRFEHLASAFRPELIDEIDGHVVGRFETGIERIGAPGSERRNGLGVEPMLPLDDGVPLDVDPATPRSTGDLGVLPRSDRHPSFAIELLELFEHDRSRRHVDTKCQGLGCEHRLDELLLEEFLDNLFECGK